LFSESAAGVAAIPGGSAEYTLTIDLGGGTTDLAVISDKGKVVHAVDSLKIGGRGMLQVVVGQANDKEKQDIERELALKSVNVPIIVALESYIQSDAKKVAVDLMSATKRPRVRQAVAAMFAAVVVAAVRLVRTVVHQQGATVNVVLLGQGWGLLRNKVLGPFDEQWFLDALRGHAAPHFTMGQTNPAADPKLALVIGALALLQNAAAADRDFIEPPVKIGVDLQGKSRVYQADQSVSDVLNLDLAPGDPGFGTVIDELTSVIARMSGPGRELGDVNGELSRVETGRGLSVRETLIHEGIHRLQYGLSDEEGQLQSSPLMRFLDGCWQAYWAGEPSRLV
jgi:hypothetical protein